MQDVKRAKKTDRSEEGRAQNGKRHKRKRRGGAVRLYVMVLFFMLTIGVVLIFTVFFKVAQIEVIGLTRYQDADVIASSGIEAGMNMFRLNRTGICGNLVAEYSYFGEVRLKYTLPDTVSILVTEAEPAGAVKQGTGYLLFSKEGRVLETNVAAPPKNVPLVKGLSETLALSAGQQMDTTDEDGLKVLLEEIAVLQKKIAGSKAGEKVLAEKQAELDGLEKRANEITTEISQRRARLAVLNAFFAARDAEGLMGVTAIDLSDPYNLIISRGSKVQIELGSEAELQAKLKRVNFVLTEKLGDDFEGVIDASYSGKTFVTPMDVAAQGMTPEEYAQFLYGSSEAQPEQSSQGNEAPAKETPGSAASQLVPVPEQSASGTPTEDDAVSTIDPADGEDFIAGEEE